MLTQLAASVVAGAVGAAGGGAAEIPILPRTLHITSAAANGGHVLTGRANGGNAGNGLEQWTGFITQEQAPAFFDTVCNYQSYLAEVHPQRGYVFDQFSSYHAGCSYLTGFFNWPGWDGIYVVEDTRFRCKFISDTTAAGDDFQVIGDLTD